VKELEKKCVEDKRCTPGDWRQLQRLMRDLFTVVADSRRHVKTAAELDPIYSKLLKKPKPLSEVDKIAISTAKDTDSILVTDDIKMGAIAEDKKLNVKTITGVLDCKRLGGRLLR